MSTVRSIAPRFSRTTFSALRPSCWRRASSASSSPKVALQFRRIPHLHGPVPRQEAADDVREILHVRSEDHRFAQRARLDRILAALRGQAFPDENHSGMLVKVFQFAGGVHQQTIHLALAELSMAHYSCGRRTSHRAPPVRGPLPGCARNAAERESETSRETAAATAGILRQNGLLAGMSAAADEQPRAWQATPSCAARPARPAPPFIQLGRVEFQAAHHVNRLRAGSPGCAAARHRSHFARPRR